MSDVSIKTMVTLDKDTFEDFNDYVATLIEGGMFRAMAEYFYRKMKLSDHAELELPWGTYHCEDKNRGETGVVNITWEPSKGFQKLLNEDNDAATKFDRNYQDTFDPEYVKLFTDYLAYGMFDPEDPKNKEQASKQRGLKLSDSEVTYFLNGYALVLYNVAKDKQRDGKMYRLEINYAFPHGSFDFEYDDDQIKVSFTANKVFKQYVKDDATHDKGAVSDFTPQTETTVVRIPADEKKAG